MNFVGAFKSLLMTQVLGAFLIGGLVVMKVTSECPASSGATDQLRTLLIGRCLQYTAFVKPDFFCDANQRVNCTAIAKTFITAFAYQNKCNVSMDRFQPFFNATNHDLPVGKSMFWEGVYELVHQYDQQGIRAFTIENSFAGYLIDRLHFCSDPTQPDGIGGPDTQDCPSYEQTENCWWNAEFSFWSAASTNFASRAKGTITVMLNASTGSAFRSDSFFGRWELPNLRSGEVTHANIWMVHVPGQEVKETCENGSISDLTARLQQKNITWRCTDNPSDVLWLLCWDNRDAAECKDMASAGANIRWNFQSVFVFLTLLSSSADVFRL